MRSLSGLGLVVALPTLMALQCQVRSVVDGNVVFEDCQPPAADFGGAVVAQASVAKDGDDCIALTGFDAGDFLVIDDFGDGVFSGSGSGSEIEQITGGTFENQEGFFTIGDLDPDTFVEIVLLDLLTGERQAVRFTIQAGDGSVPAALTEVQVSQPF